MKIAIIGAGSCGLYLAWRLSEKGYQVTVFEKKERIGSEVCSGLFSQRISDFIPESHKIIQNKITSILLHFPKKTLTVKFSKDFFVMNHYKLDNLIADLAQKAKAKIILNHPIFSLPVGFDRIIGCDGFVSTIRKNLDLPNPNFRLAIQGFILKNNYSNPEAEPSACYGAGFVETWPCEGGFIWRIPRGKEIEYGIISKPQTARKVFDNFLEKNNIFLERKKSKIVPQGFIIPSHHSVTLCGDAIGLTKPWSGGGVIWGLFGAEILLKNFPDFLKYQKEMKKFFLPKIIFSKIVTKMVYFLGFKTPWLLPKNIKIESDFLF